MTKLQHDKPLRREQDPGAVISVPDTVRPYKPTKAMQLAADQIYREREMRKRRDENAKRREAEEKRWENTVPSETARIVTSLVKVIENAPKPGPTETMKAFRLRFDIWFSSRERLDALGAAQGEGKDNPSS